LNGIQEVGGSIPPGSTTTNPNTQESRVRRRASREGYRVCKSRAWKHVPNIDNHGEFMLIETDRNFVVLGDRYDATLSEIEAFLNDAD
jgi:hypothetical protein